jgi:hypothetical protein
MTRPAAEPRWPALVALAAIGVLYLAVPERLTIGPRWSLLAVVSALLLPIAFSHRLGHEILHRTLTLAANGVVTVALVGSVAILVLGLPQHRETPVVLLRSAGALWLVNILVFALWYWRLDAGGPHARQRDATHATGAFYFPQMMRQDTRADDRPPGTPWTPGFVDYLFLAFNTSTAFSPTDTAVLERWAKVAMMLQSLVSLSVLTLLAARAVGIF